MQRGVGYKKLNQQVSIKHALHGQKSTKNKRVDRLSEQQRQKFVGINSYDLCSQFWPPSAFGGILYTLLSFGGTLAVRCPE